jgi:hypothetical protein
LQCELIYTAVYYDHRETLSADARKNAWLGEVQIAQPLPITIVAGLSLALVASSVAYAGRMCRANATAAGQNQGTEGHWRLGAFAI